MIFLFLSWVAALIILHKAGLKFFKFLIGSFGIFWFLIYYASDFIEANLLKGITLLVDLIAKNISFISVYPIYGMLTIERSPEMFTFFLDYECTGIIEVLVYISLVAFYPIHTGLHKVYYIVTGIIYISMVNTLRVLLIVFTVKLLGMDYFFLAHTVVARLVFFVFVVFLYYRTFTVPHISLQEVGD